MVVLSIDEGVLRLQESAALHGRRFFEDFGTARIDAESEQKKASSEDIITQSMVDLINSRFLGQKKSKKSGNVKKGESERQKRDKNNDISSVVESEKLALSYHQQKNLLEGYFSYLGQLRTATNIYREHFIEYGHKKEQKEEIIVAHAKTQDMTYNEFEDMIRIKKLNDMFGATMEHISASVKEKWDFLNIFPFYRILSMLRYTFSMN